MRQLALRIGVGKADPFMHRKWRMAEGAGHREKVGGVRGRTKAGLGNRIYATLGLAGEDPFDRLFDFGQGGTGGLHLGARQIQKFLAQPYFDGMSSVPPTYALGRSFA